jgi:tetratricopeptide (TPR) repeat protein
MKKLLLLLIFTSIAASAQMSDAVKQIQKQWAIVNYQTNEDDQEQAFENLAKSATQLVMNNPKDVYALVWEGIVYSTYAGVISKLKAGKKAKHARNSFEKAIKIDGTVMNGSAYTSLGVLYYKVPGWPLSFGSDKKAMKHLKKGLKYNPDGIDSNYFYAEFLYDEEGEDELAIKHLIKAQNAAPRPARPVADEGRQKEIKKLLKKIRD